MKVFVAAPRARLASGSVTSAPSPTCGRFSVGAEVKVGR